MVTHDVFPKNVSINVPGDTTSINEAQKKVAELKAEEDKKKAIEEELKNLRAKAAEYENVRLDANNNLDPVWHGTKVMFMSPKSTMLFDSGGDNGATVYARIEAEKNEWHYFTLEKQDPNNRRSPWRLRSKKNGRCMEVGPGSGSNWTGVSSKDAATSDPQRKQQSWNICMDGGGGLYRIQNASTGDYLAMEIWKAKPAAPKNLCALQHMPRDDSADKERQLFTILRSETT